MKRCAGVLCVVMFLYSAVVCCAADWSLFEYAPLRIRIEYPVGWVTYGKGDKYSDRELGSLSKDDVRNMLSNRYPKFWIKMFPEVFDGVNPQIAIGAIRLPDYPFYYDESDGRADDIIDMHMAYLDGERVVEAPSIRIRNGIEWHYVKTRASTVEGHNDAKYERFREHILVKRYGYLVEILVTNNAYDLYDAQETLDRIVDSINFY